MVKSSSLIIQTAIFSALLIFWVCSTGNCLAQSDSLAPTSLHSPRKAAILSTILPGAGQIYNKSWIKVPIVYAGLGSAGYFIYRNNKWFKSYKNEYLYRLENGVNQNPDYDVYSDDNLLTLQSTYRRWRDLSVVITTAIYVVQIVDATVDAHFFTYDVGDDISLQWCPTLNLQPGHKNPLPGIYLRMNISTRN